MDTRYSPVRRSPAAIASYCPAAPRLACVKPVASVHPEPGSNSPLYKFLSKFLRFPFATRHSSSELGSALAARRIVKSCCLYSRTAIQIEVSHKESQVRKTYQCIRFTYYIIYKVRTLLVLLLLVLCKSIQRSLLLFACQGVSLESGCKSTAFSRTHQIFLRIFSKKQRKLCFLDINQGKRGAKVVASA